MAYEVRFAARKIVDFRATSERRISSIILEVEGAARWSAKESVVPIRER